MEKVEKLWLSVDPLAEKYPAHSPYNYCLNNPVMLVDPDGREVEGVTKQDIQKFKNDMQNILSDEKFTKFNELITISGKKLGKFESGKVNEALTGIELNDEEQEFINQLVNTVNSTDIHRVEYLSSEDNISSDGKETLVNYLNKVQDDFGDALASPGFIRGAIVKGLGGSGLNVPMEGGSHSFILEGDNIKHDGGRAVTSGHEVLGHGPASARGLSDQDNNTRAIRMDNLIRGVMYIGGFRDGSNHAGGKVDGPYLPPSIIK